MIARPRTLGRDTERLIGVARVFLAGAALIAPYFDPHNGLKTGLCVTVIGYGLIAGALLAARFDLGRPTLRKAMHGMDLAFATVMLQSPNGGAYFLILATFCLLSCAVQWRWRVVLATGAYLLVAYLAAVAFGVVTTERMTIRTAYLIAVPVGTALASRNAAESRNRLLKLARWASARYSDTGDGVLRVFRHASDVLEAEEVTVFYHEIDQPRAIKATYTRQTDRVASGPSEIWPEETTAVALRRQAFVVVDPEQGLCLTHAGMKRIADPTPGIGLSASSGLVVSAHLTGDFCSGRLFACGIKRWRWDQIVLVEIVASHVRSRLEGRLLRDRTARIAANLERMRLSRDLHDGILQSLTAARLQLSRLSRAAPELDAEVGAIAGMLQDEQQKLREFVEHSRTTSGELVSVTRIADRIGVVAEHWRLRADIVIDGAETEISDALYREIYFIVGEAMANSARHGRATSIVARLSCGPERFVFALEELDAANSDPPARIVPRSIDERIRELGGSLSVSRGPRGVSLKVELPTHG